MENNIKHYYYESDFKLVDLNVQEGVPFEFRYYVKRSGEVVIASYDGEKYTGCRPSDEVAGAIVVPFDGGKLGIGMLKVKRVYDIVDADMADGVFNSVTEQVLPVELWRGPSDDVAGDAVIVYDSLYRGAPGKSAYQTWLDLGNVGSEQDFIDSLGGGGGGGGVTIVNNLTEGGANKALSAEMGKELAERGRAMTETIFGYGESIGYIADVMATKEDLSEYAKSADVQSAIEEVNAKIDMYKEATIDFGTGEDTVTMAIMDSGTTITKVKMKNVKTLYLSYGNVTKAEYVGGEVPLGNADFLVMTIIRTASDVDAVVGLTLR